MKWIFFLLLATSVMADSGPKELEGYDAANDEVEEGSTAGAFLIYNCKDSHWACVISKNFDECREKRDEDLKGEKKVLRCAPIAEFPTKKSCFQRQLFMVSQAYANRVCISDIWKQREMH